jgi:hypothetical protein|uniref:Uncharacterized protein n=1 Tax=viral metagenome TaxID=1070528 RepID=A0A6C0IZ66_9ZZZZ
MKYNTNPCGICKEIYKEPEYKVNAVNSCFVNSATAFLGYPSNNLIQCDTLDKWNDCMNQTKNERMDMYPSSYQLRMSPSWGQTPHYFPRLLNENNSIQNSYDQCNELCKKDKFPNDCQLNCYIDANSVIPVKENFEENFEEKIKNPKYDSEGNRIENSYKNLNKNSITYNKLEKAHPFIFWATFIIFITLFIFIINYFIKSLFTKF